MDVKYQRVHNQNMEFDFNEVPRPTFALISLKAIEDNLNAIKKFTQKKIMGVVKANAYGHGIIPVAQFLESKVDYLGVALHNEGVLLRKAGIKKDILVFGGFEKNQIPYHFDYNLDFTVSSAEKLEQIAEMAKDKKKVANIHLKIDTGMGRIGVRPASAIKLIEEALRFCDRGQIAIKGIYSHLACAEEKENPLNLQQIELFDKACTHFNKVKAPMPLRHLANSAGLLNFPQSHFDMVRPGLALYGVSPLFPGPLPFLLTPALKLVSTIVYFKVVLKNQGVGYNPQWIAPKDTRVVTIPMGYADGLPWSLGNKGKILIRGKEFPVIGKICMDQFMANIDHEEAFNGDEVVIIGKQNQNSIQAEELAQMAQTSVYEILVRLSDRVPRIYSRGQA